MSERWTENRVYELLNKVFPTGAYTLLPQVRNGTGFARKTTRTADAIAVSNWPSRGLYLAGVEIKVSLSDWRKELATPEKADDISRYCKYWYIAAPAGVVPVGEVPESWGLIECDARNAKIIKAGIANESPQPIDILLLAAILRTIAETTVPKSAVQGQIAAAVEQRASAVNATVKHDFEQLQQDVADFEAVSGVTLKSYAGGRIGEAVRRVLDGKDLLLLHQLAAVEQAANNVLKITRVLREREGNES